MKRSPRAYARRARLLAAPVAGVAILAALPTTGHTASIRHIPGPGNGLPPSTNAPDLSAVAIANIPGSVAVNYCFNKPVDSVGPKTAYFVHTYDSSRALQPTNVSKSTADEKCVVGTFADGTDLGQGTVGTVGAGAVKDVSGRSSIVASEPLGGGTTTLAAGATTGPDLTNVTVNTADASNKKVVFTFDEALDSSANASASNFIAYDSAGQPTPLSGTVSIQGPNAVVNVGSQAIDGASVFAVGAGAVRSTPETAAFAPNANALTTPSSPGTFGTNAARPSVASATQDGPQGYQVKFNQRIQVTSGANNNFIAILDDGSAVASTNVQAEADDSTVGVTFSKAVNADPTAVVRILAQGGAVKASDGTTNSVFSQVAVDQARDVTGKTNGPDLESATPDLNANRVTYVFDENVSGTPAASSLLAFAADGSTIASTGGVVVDGAKVTANFPSTLSSAVDFGVNYAAVSDALGFPNPNGSVSKDAQAAPAPTPTPTPTPAPTGKKTHFKTTVSIKRRDSKYKYGGTLSTKGRGCKVGRRVVLRVKGKGTKSYGSTSSNSKGQYVVKRSSRLRGKKVYVAVAERNGKKYPLDFCSAGKSKTISG